VEGSLHTKNKLDSSSHFDTNPTCKKTDIQTDGHRAIAYTGPNVISFNLSCRISLKARFTLPVLTARADWRLFTLYFRCSQSSRDADARDHWRRFLWFFLYFVYVWFSCKFVQSSLSRLPESNKRFVRRCVTGSTCCRSVLVSSDAVNKP